MPHDLRRLEPAELDDALGLLAVAFAHPSRPEDAAVERALCEPGRFYGAFDGGRLVGTCGSFALELTVPGGPRPVAGVTWVGVAPTHHRQGIATAMMRRQLDDLHAAGEPVAALWASEGAIYQRFGYGPASFSLRVQVPSRAPLARPVATGGLRLVEPAEAALAPAFEQVRPHRVGWYARDADWWRYRLHDPEHARGGAGPLQAVVDETVEGEAGYALYATKSQWGPTPNGTAQVRELVATGPQVAARLWRYLLDLDLIGTVDARGLPLDDPLLHLLAGPRTATPTVADALWVRLVDVPAALSARSYAAPVDVVLEVEDAFCSWNSGRVRLAADERGATCTPTTDPADLRLGAADLGAAYLGGPTLLARAGAGFVQELRPGTLTAVSRALSWSSLPSCPLVF